MRGFAYALLLAGSAVSAHTAHAAEPSPPPVFVWLQGTGGPAKTPEGWGIAGGSAVSAGWLERRDFVRVKFSYFGEDGDPDRTPEADWMQTWALLYGGGVRGEGFFLTAAAGLGSTSGFARGKRLYETPGVEEHTWYRPRRFHAIGVVGEAFAGVASTHVAGGVTLTADANPVRPWAALQFTFAVGTFP